MENLARHSEILFIWDATMCNPNGDMASDNAPRFDDVDEKAIVSDVRVKRTIRDDLQYRKKKLIYINNEEIVQRGQNAEDRFKQIKDQSDLKEDLPVFLTCIDNRLFGGVAPKSNIQLVGPVQFSWTKSLNKTETVLKPGTGGFATKGKDGEAKYTKTFRADNYIPYGLFAMYGTINRLQAVRANTSEEDVREMLDSLWFGTKLINTRSKQGQKSRLLIRIVYKENSSYFIGLINELVKVRNEESEMIRGLDEIDIDFTNLISAINKADRFIDTVHVVCDDSLQRYRTELEKINSVKIIDEVEFASLGNEN
ncbi:putative CPISPR-associated protein Cas2 (Csh2 family protein) [Desulforapulum autotrophicum HRM2]|uniref:CPISPR-associated protein Cas2 (Csh2 family protein) n=1 Tax=Desulforapulum autotrophicum (strain ATCC 43914 / DSM 3382 / VKM B-1955 / HRM2) TaxID=177437 RepID=C0QHV6_DESAH|nr:type I-B CRISPR-associated protein Cas7/Csh2 [Desulforapulum autotrophicum]ACN13664.1 putative CPISPR-associated protein Cas2 (Csh2 family protein) [Desulforapulum autotrophicum HRM2]